VPVETVVFKEVEVFKDRLVESEVIREVIRNVEVPIETVKI
jgi:hypothetical protein